MYNKLFIYIQNREATKLAWTFFNNKGHVSQGATLNHFPPEVAGAEIIVFFPTEEILLTEVTLPPANKSQQLSATLYALEDKLADDIEQLHAVIEPSSSTSLFFAGVIRKSLLEIWLQKCQTHKLNPSSVLPDIFLVPYQENKWTILPLENRVLVRTALYQGFACVSENFDTIVNQTTHPEIVTLPQNHWANYLTEFKAFNLLQGKYSHRRQMRPHWKKPLPWGISLLLMISILVITKIIFLNIQNNDIDHKIAALYREIYPQATNVSSPEARIEQEMKRLAGTTQQQEVLYLIAKIQVVLKTLPGIHIESFNYRDTILLINIHAKNFEQLETFAKQLSQQGLQVKQNDAIRKEGIVVATLSINTEKTA